MTSTRAHNVNTSALRTIQMVAGLPEDVLQQLTAQCAWRSYRAGQQIISREARDRQVYMIVAGRVRVAVYSANGREVAFRDVGAGSVFGEIAAIDGEPRSANVEALEASTIASMPPQLFWQLLENHPVVMKHVVRTLAATIRSLSERLFELSTLGIQNRVHAEILRLAKAAGTTRGRATIDPAPRHVELASRISANREQVTKELSAMARQGLAVKSGRALVVPDIGKLESLVAEVRRTG